MSLGSTTSNINMVTNTNTNTNLHKVNSNNNNNNNNTTNLSSSSQDTGSTSSTAIYIDEHMEHNNNNNNNNTLNDDSQCNNICNKNNNNNNNNNNIDNNDASQSNLNMNMISENNNNNNKHIRFHNPPNSSHSNIFGHDYIKNFVILSKLYSPQEYYSNILNNNKKYKSYHKGSDCPSDISSMDSIGYRKRKNKHTRVSKRVSKLISYLKELNTMICHIIRVSFDFVMLSISKFQTWQKELHEAPIEVKEKYFFVISTIISTILFYILFLCLDIMIKHWFALPKFLTEYSFSISYCISYLTSVIWQHFFNQYFVFAVFNQNILNTRDNNMNSNYFCDSLLRTYLVYGCSLLMTGIIGSLLQIYVGISDEFILFLTLPISGVMNYYLLRYCHNKHNLNLNSNGYQLLATNEIGANQNKKYHRSKTCHSHAHKPRHMNKKMNHKYNNKKKKHNHNHAIDDIVIV